MEAQRQSFQAELDRVEKMWERKSKLLEDEIKLLKTTEEHTPVVKNRVQPTKT